MSTVSAIIVNWNGKHMLSDCLDALQRQTRQADEILVVDNGSSDGSQALIRARYPHVRLVELDDNRGFSIANNIGIRQARGDYVALLNNDMIPEPEWMARMAAALDAQPSLGSCASKILFYDRRDTIDSAGISVVVNGGGAARGMQDQDAEPFQHSSAVFGACAGAAMYRMAMLRDIGLFDEDLYIYFEDVDLAFRAQLAGYDCLYVSEAVAYHHHGASSGRFGTNKKQYYLARNSLLVIVKDMPAPLLRRHLARIMVGQIPFALDAARNGYVGSYARSRLDAMRLLPRMLQKRRAIHRAARRTHEEIAGRLS